MGVVMCKITKPPMHFWFELLRRDDDYIKTKTLVLFSCVTFYPNITSGDILILCKSHLIKSKYSMSLKLECGWTTFVPNKRCTSFSCVHGTDLASSLGTAGVSCRTSPWLPCTLFSEDVPQLRFCTGPINTKGSSPPWAHTHTHSRVHKRSNSPPLASSCSSAYSSSRLMN